MRAVKYDTHNAGTMQKPKISILMPVFNSGKYIAETLDTVIAQTFTDWEVVLMDGGSTDETLTVARRYAAAHPNIRVFSEPDEGVYDAINKAFTKATGEFVYLLCASDGYLERRWFEQCVAAFEHDPEIAVVWGIPMGFSPDGATLEPAFGYGHFLLDQSGGRKPLLKELARRLVHPKEWWRLFKKMDAAHLAAIKSAIVKSDIPQKKEFFRYWLSTGLFFPDGNMCVARSVFAECLPLYVPGTREPGDWPEFYFNFNRKGYLSHGIPIPANFSQTGPGANEVTRRARAYNDAKQEAYFKKLAEFRREIKAHPETMVFRARSGEPIAVQ